MRRTLNDWAGNLVALVLTIAGNALVNVLRFGGTTTGAVSDKYASLFTPAGFTFAIWSLIYVLLAGFVIYQALPAQRDSALLARVSPWFKVGCVANVLWLIAWHLEWLSVSLLLMVLLLASLIKIYRILGIVDRTRSVAERWLVQLPFSVYLGWITVATIANLSSVQSATALNDVGLGETNWTLLKLAVAGAIAAIVVLRRNDVAYGLVISWAAFGVSAGQAATPAVAGAALAICLVAFAVSAGEALRLLVSR